MRSLILALFSVVPLTFAAQIPPASRTTIIERVTVIDGTGASPRPDVTVVITGDRISSVEPGGSAGTALPAAHRIDGRGTFLIPGLWDMHVHLTATTETACPVLVASGVTSVRDMGGDLTLIDWMRGRIEQGDLVGPAIYRAGPFVDGSKPGVQDRLVVSTASDGRAAADFLKLRGVDVIKTHTATPRDAYFALLSGARANGLHVTGHVPFTVTPEEAIEAGHHSLEHVVSLFEGTVAEMVQRRGISQEQALAELTDDHFRSLAARMVARGTWFDPTLIAYWTRSNQWDLVGDPRNRYISATGRESWKMFRDLPDTAEMRALQARAFQRFTEITRVVHRGGVRFLVGTDLGGKYIFPGSSVHDELSLFVKAGLTPLEALQAATGNAAAALGIEDSGTIRTGNVADLVLLRADPSIEITNTTRIEAVIRRGRLLERQQLDELLRSAAAEAPRR
jgi:imidazolonepropionase-like amidohydrolase